MESAQSGSGILAPDPPRPHSTLSFKAKPPPVPPIGQASLNPTTLVPAPCWSHDPLCFWTFLIPFHCEAWHSYASPALAAD